MTDEELKRGGEIALLSTQVQTGAIIRQKDQSDLQVFKDTLDKQVAESRTVKELEKLIELRGKLQKLDIENSKLNHANKWAKMQIEDKKQKNTFQRSQQVFASVASVVIGLYFMQALPLASLLFLVLGLARPLGYSLGEISDLFGGLTGFSKEPNKLLSNENIQEIQSEEPTNERY